MANADDVAASLIRQTTAFVVGSAEAPLPTDKPITMMLVKEGIMKVRRTQIGTFCQLVSKMEDMKAEEIIPFLESAGDNVASVAKMIVATKGKKEIEGLLSASSFRSITLSVPRIPINLLHQTIDFFRKVHDKQGTEAAVLIRWSPKDQRHYIEVPDQDLSGGGVKYKADSTNLDPIIIDIHSHHTMSPFFSPVDDNDEKSTQFYGVVGHIEVSHPAVNIRARMDGADICYLKPELLFDMEVSPVEWMNKIKEPPKDLYLPGKYRDEHRWPPYEGHGKKTDGEIENESEVSTQTGRSEIAKRYDPLGSTSVAGLFDDPVLLEAAEAIWTGVEREILDYPAVFSNRANLDLIKTVICEKIDEIEESDMEEISKR